MRYVLVMACAAFVAAGVFGLALDARADVEWVSNGGFESPDLADGATGVPTGWTMTAGGGTSIGINPTEAMFTGADGDGELPSPASGSQCVSMTAATGYCHITQGLGNMLPNTVYTVSGDFGTAIGQAYTGEVDLYLVGNSEMPFAITPMTVGGAGTFTHNAFTWNSSAGGAYVGLPLNVAVYWPAGSGQVMIDNISVTTIPEPSTVVLVMTGLIGLLAYAWRKRR